MAFENTHLFIAQKVLSQIKNKSIRKIILDNIDFYNLGSVFPDTFYYRKNKKFLDISNMMHGNSELTNKVVFKILDLLKNKNDEKNLAFLFGYLTHCATDIVFHPIIFYLSGYKYTSNEKKMEKYKYIHSLLETKIDCKVNNKYYLEEIIKTSIAKDLIIDKVINASKKEIEQSLIIQKIYFKLFRNKYWYRILRVMHSVGIVKNLKLGCFYASLEYEKIQLPNKIIYKDLFNGKKKQTNINNLLQDSFKLSISTIEAAYKYSKDDIKKPELRKIISGQDLNTGIVGKSKIDIVFSKKI